MGRFVEDRLSLKLNQKKSKIFPIAQGVNAIGFKIYPTHRLLRNDSKKTIKRKAKKLRPLLETGRVPVKVANQIFGSWSGHAQHGNSYNFVQKLVAKHDYIYIENKGGRKFLKVNADKLARRKEAA